MHPFTNSSAKRALVALSVAVVASRAAAQEIDPLPTSFEQIAESIERNGSALTEPRLLGFVSGPFDANDSIPTLRRPAPLSFLEGMNGRPAVPAFLGPSRPSDDPFSPDRLRLDGASRSV